MNIRARVRAVVRYLRVSGAVRRVGASFRAARWHLRLQRSIALPVRFDLLAGQVANNAVFVVICLWNRPERLRALLDGLASQRDCPPIRLVLWNNNTADDSRYRAMISEFTVSGALSSVELHTNAVNLGGLARFIAARKLINRSEHQPFLMLDDDQDPGRCFVRDALAQYTPNSFAGVWAFRLKTGYWDREELTHGDKACYVGTGGSICDGALLRSRTFFSRLPYRYAFVEDLWASAYFTARSATVRKLDTPVAFTDSVADQHHDLVWLKAEFFEYLVARFPAWSARCDAHNLSDEEANVKRSAGRGGR